LSKADSTPAFKAFDGERQHASLCEVAVQAQQQSVRRTGGIIETSE
jgi:hypothetical protein